MRLLRWFCLGFLLAGSAALAADLDEVKAKGVLRVAVYKGFAPFSDDGKGIDVDLAEALAKKLGVRMSLMPFDADEKVEDDLRNMVWKGHYLGYGPADVMMHVPVDRAFIERNKQVKIFAPYFREKVQIARDVKRLPTLVSLEPFKQEPIGVEGDTLADIMLLSAEGGSLRSNVRHFKTTFGAIDELKGGQLVAVMGLRSELQSAVGQARDYEISDPPLAGLPPSGWALGLAVKADHEALAVALQKAMNDLQTEGELNRIFANHGVQRLAP